MRSVGYGTSGSYDANIEIGDGSGVYWKFLRNQYNSFEMNMSSTLGITGGNVGFGTTTPLEMLDVRGNIALGNYQTNAQSYYIGVGSGSSGSFGTNSGFSGIEFGAPQSEGSGYIAFSTHHYGYESGERMRIDEVGNVGIGTTNPTVKLDVEGTGPVMKIVDGNQQSGYVLTSDAQGNASWQPASSGGSAHMPIVFPVITAGSGQALYLEANKINHVTSTVSNPNFQVDFPCSASEGDYMVVEITFANSSNAMGCNGNVSFAQLSAMHNIGNYGFVYHNGAWQ